MIRASDLDKKSRIFVKIIQNAAKQSEQPTKICKTASNDYEKSNMFAQMLQNTMVHSKPKDDRDRLKTHQVDTAVEAFINKKQIPRSRPYIVTRSEIDRHLARFSASAPGPDKVTYKILKNLPVCVKSYLALIITSSVNNGVVPSN